MVASLVRKENNQWYCSACRMRQGKLRERCEFCWRIFSNYEDMLLEQIEEVIKDEIVEERNFILN